MHEPLGTVLPVALGAVRTGRGLAWLLFPAGTAEPGPQQLPGRVSRCTASLPSFALGASIFMLQTLFCKRGFLSES